MDRRRLPLVEGSGTVVESERLSINKVGFTEDEWDMKRREIRPRLSSQEE